MQVMRQVILIVTVFVDVVVDVVVVLIPEPFLLDHGLAQMLLSLPLVDFDVVKYGYLCLVLSTCRDSLTRALVASRRTVTLVPTDIHR